LISFYLTSRSFQARFFSPKMYKVELIARVERHCGKVDRIPGISSVQIACARGGLAMEETLFFTLHARDGIQAALEEIVAAAAAGKRHLIILPLPWSFMPRR